MTFAVLFSNWKKNLLILLPLAQTFNKKIPTMNQTLTLIGRIIFALTIAYFGIGHLTSAQAMTGLVPAMFSGVATPLVYLTGVCLLLASVSMLINKWMRWAGILLAVFLVLTVLMVHVPNLAAPEEMAKMTAMTMIVKDMAMAAAALIIAGMDKS